jgi:predicted acyl esterase
MRSSKFNPETPTTLVEGPWVHGGWARGDGSHLGDVQFNAKTSEYFRANIQFPFFEHYLKGKGAAQPKAVVFETGTNVWRSFDSWPPKAATPKTLYFHAGGKLSFDPPTESARAWIRMSAIRRIRCPLSATRRTRAAALHGRRSALRQLPARCAGLRDDVLTEDVTIAGPISPKLKIASTARTRTSM